MQILNLDFTWHYRVLLQNIIKQNYYKVCQELKSTIVIAKCNNVLLRNV